MADVGARLLRTRWFVRAPIWLFRARLGFVFGGRALLLEHIGRKSGQSRYVVVETVSRPDPRTVIVASGFGASQWYRNLQAHAECWVSIGLRNRVPTTARMMDTDEAKAVLAEYRQAHPAAYQQLSGIIEKAIGQSIDAVPLIELTMHGH